MRFSECFIPKLAKCITPGPVPNPIFGLPTHFYPEIGVLAKKPQNPGKVPDVQGSGDESIGPVFDQLTGAATI